MRNTLLDAEMHRSGYAPRVRALRRSHRPLPCPVETGSMNKDLFRAPLNLRWATVGLLAVLAACGDSGSASGGSADASAIASSARRRLMEPKVVNVRELIDKGRPDLARAVLDSFGAGLSADLGVEGPLLRARISFLEGNSAEWLTFVEEARGIDPKDPRTYATAVEIYAAMNRLDAARAELQRGAAAVGSVVTPELQRAQGIVAIVTPGGGRTGLRLLEAAYRADPALPFMARPLGQAYYLMAQVAFAGDQPELAFERMEASLGFDPEDIDARQFYGELLLGAKGDFVAGLDVLEQIYAEGQPIGADLGRHHWRAGLAAQLQAEPAIARKHYLRAKALGCPDVESGTARTFMREQGKLSLERALLAASISDEQATRVAVAEFVGLRSDPEEVSRREAALSMVAAANEALGAREFDRASGLISGAVTTDRGASGIVEVQSGVLQAKAIAALEVGESGQALRYATEATQVRPSSAMGWHMLGELQHAMGQFEPAAASLLKATSYARAAGDPLGTEVSQMLAECQHLSQNASGAVATLEQALRDVRPGEADRRDEIVRYLKILRN